MRTQNLLKRHPRAFVWRMDVAKFYDNVDHAVLKNCLRWRVQDLRLIQLCDEVIDSFAVVPSVGIPIGNLTSQIFSNIYLNEFDRFVRHRLRPLAYVRYGDDCAIFAPTRQAAREIRNSATLFLRDSLRLKVNPKNDIIVPAGAGLKFLGHYISSIELKVDKRTTAAALGKVKFHNLASYKSLRFDRTTKRRFDPAAISLPSTHHTPSRLIKTMRTIRSRLVTGPRLLDRDHLCRHRHLRDRDLREQPVDHLADAVARQRGRLVVRQVVFLAEQPDPILVDLCGPQIAFIAAQHYCRVRLSVGEKLLQPRSELIKRRRVCEVEHENGTYSLPIETRVERPEPLHPGRIQKLHFRVRRVPRNVLMEGRPSRRRRVRIELAVRYLVDQRGLSDGCTADHNNPRNRPIGAADDRRR
jgi:hypothetical protein